MKKKAEQLLIETARRCKRMEEETAKKCLRMIEEAKKNAAAEKAKADKA